MKLSAVILTLAALVSATSLVESVTNPITIKGYKMFDAKTGQYFSAKGIDYYPRPNAGELDQNNIDFFTDAHEKIWSKDIEYLTAAGANAIRLYAVDPSKPHDKFMCALQAAGIYVLVDLGASCKGCGISNDPYPACYPPSLKSRGEQIINAFAKFHNVLGFSAGNEVNHVVTNATINAPCQKKFIRDMRKFIAGCGKTMRAIPVGVVLADTDREDNAKYYNCRTDASDTLENAEWYGLNAYQYCDSTQTTAAQATGFTNMVTDFLSYKTSVPVMLTEFGCLSKSFPKVGDYEAQRTWLQAGWLHTEEFRQVFSGGFAFEYSTENANSKGDSPYPFKKVGGQNYGLGYYSPANCDHGAVPCVYNPMGNYESLKKQYKAVDTSAEGLMGDFEPESDRKSPPKCPSGFADLKDIEWEADSLASEGCPAAPLATTCSSQTTASGVASTPDSDMVGGNSSSEATGDDSPSSGSGSTATETPTPNAVAKTTTTNSTTNSTTSSSASSPSSLCRTLATSTLTIGLSTAVVAALFL